MLIVVIAVAPRMFVPPPVVLAIVIPFLVALVISAVVLHDTT